MHAVAEVLELKEPAGHFSQLVLPGLVAYCPGRQGWHTAPVIGSDIVPLGQSVQRGSVQRVGSSRCRDAFQLVLGRAVHA